MADKKRPKNVGDKDGKSSLLGKKELQQKSRRDDPSKGDTKIGYNLDFRESLSNKIDYIFSNSKNLYRDIEELPDIAERKYSSSNLARGFNFTDYILDKIIDKYLKTDKTDIQEKIEDLLSSISSSWSDKFKTDTDQEIFNIILEKYLYVYKLYPRCRSKLIKLHETLNLLEIVENSSLDLMLDDKDIKKFIKYHPTLSRIAFQISSDSMVTDINLKNISLPIIEKVSNITAPAKKFKFNELSGFQKSISELFTFITAPIVNIYNKYQKNKYQKKIAKEYPGLEEECKSLFFIKDDTGDIITRYTKKKNFKVNTMPGVLLQKKEPEIKPSTYKVDRKIRNTVQKKLARNNKTKKKTWGSKIIPGQVKKWGIEKK